jgi:hypothetical protein
VDTFVWIAFCISLFLLGIGIGGVIEYRRSENALDKFEEARYRLQMVISQLALMNERVDLIGRYDVTQESEYEDDNEDLTITREMKVYRNLR